MAKFLGLTAVLAVGAGAGIGGYLLLSDDKDEDTSAEQPSEQPPAEQPSAQIKTDLPSPAEPPSEPMIEHDDGKLRLDIPHHPSNTPSARPGDAPGPDVEVAG